MLLKPTIEAKTKENQSKGGNSAEVDVQNSAHPLKTRDEVARAAGVSHDTISKEEQIEAKADPEAEKKLEDGTMCITEI